MNNNHIYIIKPIEENKDWYDDLESIKWLDET